MEHSFNHNFISDQIKKIIKKIPPGQVATYGQIAFLAGFPGSTRQVVWILHSCSEKEKLPWHRVVNRKGTISLKPNAGFEKQKWLYELTKYMRADIRAPFLMRALNRLKLIWMFDRRHMISHIIDEMGKRIR